MLGKTAGGLFWLVRYLERAENTARLLEAGFRLALTRGSGDGDEWASVLSTVGCLEAYEAKHRQLNADSVIDFLVRDRDNPMSVVRSMWACRDNARLTRTALTREVWENVNEAWLNLKAATARPLSHANVPDFLALVRRSTSLVRGSINGTMLRNDIFAFMTLGAFVERADNTSRILDVKYYVLLPSGASIGSSLDNMQWDMILRSASAERSFYWLNEGDANPLSISRFLILDRRLPRSLLFCCDRIVSNLGHLASEYGEEKLSHGMAQKARDDLASKSIDDVFARGLHEFLQEFVSANARLSSQIETDYRFYV